MVSHKNTGIFLILLLSFCWSNSAYSRQNIVIGEITSGYDFTERKYDENDIDFANDVAAGINPNDTDEGDTRRWLVTPRIRVSSRSIDDLLEFTYAPTLYYDDILNDNNVGHDLNLFAEKSFTKNWSVNVSDNYYYGDDAVEDQNLSTATITEATDGTEAEQTVGAEQTNDAVQSPREQNVRREYWRNNFNIGTDYTFAQDSVLGFGYTFGALRNVSDDTDGYDDYDRHEGTGRLSYRFNRAWQMESEVGYIRGYYDPTEVTYVQPEIVSVPVGTDTNGETVYEEQTVYNQTQEQYNDDLEEYRGRLRTNYYLPARDRFFGQYSYDATDYESALREDSAIHDITLGWDHDFSSSLHTTLSGGPAFVSFGDRSTETGYNAYAGLVWDLRHASLTANTSYGYEFNNFDGDRTGLSKTWRSVLDYLYQFSPQLSLSLTSGYTRSDNEEPAATTVVLNTEGEDTTDDGVTEYTEELYYAGLRLNYSFLSWLTLSTSYRYADYQSENDLDYDEHRVLLTLTASKEVFRW